MRMITLYTKSLYELHYVNISSRGMLVVPRGLTQRQQESHSVHAPTATGWPLIRLRLEMQKKTQTTSQVWDAHLSSYKSFVYNNEF